jgi:hypothetical protein
MHNLTELSHDEMVEITGGEPISLTVAAYLVGSFLAGVAIGIALAE